MNTEWDAFISHASEDKLEFVEPLARELRSRGLNIWYDNFTLTIGDSLRRSIDRGLAHSKYGVVVLSPSFFAKEWPQKELDGLVAREVDGRKVILPVWHRIDAPGICAYSPMLADRVAVSSSRGVAAVADAIVAGMGIDVKPVSNRSLIGSPAKEKKPRYVEGEATPKYREAAQQLFGAIKSKAEEQKQREMERVNIELKRSHEFAGKMRQIEQEVAALVSSFNAVGSRVALTLQISQFPINIFREAGRYRILLSFGDEIYWMIRFVTYPSGTVALQLVRVRGTKEAAVDDNFTLTNDSINFVLMEDQFGVSLNQGVSKEVLTDIVGDLPKQPRALNEFVSAVVTLLRRAIERELISRAM